MAGGKLEPAIGLGAKAPLCHLMREYPASRRFAAMTTIPQKLPPARQPPITAGIAERPFDARMAPSVWSAGSLQLFPGRQGDRSRGRAGWRAFRGPVIQPCGIAGGSVGQFQRGQLVGAIDQEGDLRKAACTGGRGAVGSTVRRAEPGFAHSAYRPQARCQPSPRSGLGSNEKASFSKRNFMSLAPVRTNA